MGSLYEIITSPGSDLHKDQKGWLHVLDLSGYRVLKLKYALFYAKLFGMVLLFCLALRYFDIHDLFIQALALSLLYILLSYYISTQARYVLQLKSMIRFVKDNLAARERSRT